jgi:hypothetical protein
MVPALQGDDLGAGDDLPAWARARRSSGVSAGNATTSNTV